MTAGRLRSRASTLWLRLAAPVSPGLMSQAAWRKKTSMLSTRPMDSATRSLAGSRALRMKSAFVRASVAKTVCDSRRAAACSHSAMPMEPATTKSRNGAARRSQRVEARGRGMRSGGYNVSAGTDDEASADYLKSHSYNHNGSPQRQCRMCGPVTVVCQPSGYFERSEYGGPLSRSTAVMR